jgi:hypothetical protein
LAICRKDVIQCRRVCSASSSVAAIIAIASAKDVSLRMVSEAVSVIGIAMGAL